MRFERKQYQSVTRGWVWDDLMGCDPSGYLAVTLTMKKTCDRKYNDVAESSANMRYFLNRLNQRVYGNAHRRYGRRLTSIPVREVDAHKRPHYHLILQRPPDHISHQDYCALIDRCWQATPFGHKQIDVKPVSDVGWVSYVTKFKGMEDEVDWINVCR